MARRSLRGERVLLMRAILMAGLLLWLGTPSWAATYYVSKSGNNANTCTQAQSQGTPKLTITAGLGCLASADTLTIGAGTYAERLNNVIPSGTGPSFAGMTLMQAVTGATVIVQPATGGCNPGDRPLLLSGDTAIHIRDIVFDASNCPHDALKIEATGAGVRSSFIRLERVTARGATLGQGMLVDADDWQCLNCIARDNVSASGGCLRHGLYFTGPSERGLISGGEFFDNTGYGIHATQNANPKNSTIEKTKVHDNLCGGIIVDGTGNLVRNNLSWSNTGPGFQNNNQFVRFYHNTAWNNTGAGFLFQPGTDPATQVKNNIFFGNSSAISPANCNGAICASNTPVDPSFVNAVGGDFRLATGSVARNAGQNLLADVPTDFDGVARDSVPDTGAYEFVGPDTMTPVAPRGLIVIARGTRIYQSSLVWGVLTMIHQLFSLVACVSLILTVWQRRQRLVYWSKRVYLALLQTVVGRHAHTPDTLTVEGALQEAEAILREQAMAHVASSRPNGG